MTQAEKLKDPSLAQRQEDAEEIQPSNKKSHEFVQVKKAKKIQGFLYKGHSVITNLMTGEICIQSPFKPGQENYLLLRVGESLGKVPLTSPVWGDCLAQRLPGGFQVIVCRLNHTDQEQTYKFSLLAEKPEVGQLSDVSGEKTMVEIWAELSEPEGTYYFTNSRFYIEKMEG